MAGRLPYANGTRGDVRIPCFPHLLPHLTVVRNIMLPLAFRGPELGKTAKLTAQMLEAVGITALAAADPRELSGKFRCAQEIGVGRTPNLDVKCQQLRQTNGYERSDFRRATPARIIVQHRCCDSREGDLHTGNGALVSRAHRRAELRRTHAECGSRSFVQGRGGRKTP